MNPPGTKQPRFITVEEAIGFQEIAIAKYGGAIGLRDRGLLESALAQPQQQFGGEYAHEFPFGIAAAYAFFIAKNHPFFDGNKRAALLCAGAFLRMNGWSLESDGVEAADQVIALVEGKTDRDGFAAWLKAHSRPLPSMELREFFRAFDYPTFVRAFLSLLPAVTRAEATELVSTSVEASLAMPALIGLAAEQEEATRLNDSDRWTKATSLGVGLCALYRIAEDLGYEW